MSRTFVSLLLLFLCLPSIARSDEVKILLPLKRTAYQTNEWIPVCVVRTARPNLLERELVLQLKGQDGSQLRFVMAAPKMETTSAVEHLHLNGWLIRPGKYTLEASCGGDSAPIPIELYDHIRRSSFRLINWGRAREDAQLPQGEDNLGFNLFYGHYANDDRANFIRAGVDYVSNCVMSGGHQMDLRLECDWSDPWVIRGGTRRVTRQAFIDRTRPNVLGVHFYDEPGLTWLKHPETGEFTPQGVPPQMRAFESAFGIAPLAYHKVKPKDPEHVRRWAHWARWKLGFMDAAWKDAQFGVSSVRPDFLSLTQSQYGWPAFTDGYYFNVVRSLPLISGHGGYHDYGPGFFNPSMTLEFARARDLSRSNWYLPAWYGNTTADEFRLEQHLSFQTNIQGMMSPPDLEPGYPEKCKAIDAIVETNHRLGRLGTIFTTMPVTRPPVAMLISLSQMIHDQTLDRKINYAHNTPHGRNITFTYLASKLIQQPFMVVLDEDIRDGTLAANHKVLIVTSVDHLDQPVVEGIEAFIKQGGLVLMTADCQLKLQGAVILGAKPGFPDSDKIAALAKEGKAGEKAATQLTTMRHALRGAKQLADAIVPHLEKIGIKPVFQCDEPGIAATLQAAGDIEYLFAVNASHDPNGDPRLGIRAATATIGVAADGRPIYDVIHGRQLTWKKNGSHYQEQLHFGPGQMRIFARTRRPIGGVKTSAPLLHRDYTRADMPIRLDIAAVLLDDQGGLLSGSAPLQIRVLDPLGKLRYDLYRATDNGTLKLSLPLAINDPAGKWHVEVIELLSSSRSVSSFTYSAAQSCGFAAGRAHRAVHLDQDRKNVFGFFRKHTKVTIVKGSGDYDAATERLAKILRPWNITCAVVAAAEVNKARTLTEEEAKTWVGLQFAAKGQITPGSKNNPALVGFAIDTPAILLGTPEDNPLIKVLVHQKFLPYVPDKETMPGPRRGYIAWQREGLGVLQESVTLIAYDKEGMAEAVGSCYEMVAGIEPLTRFDLPRTSRVVAGTRAAKIPDIAEIASVMLPDRIDGLKADGNEIRVVTHAEIEARLATDGTIIVLKKSKVTGPAFRKGVVAELRTPLATDKQRLLYRKAAPNRLAKFVVPSGNRTAVAYWGGTLALFDENGVLCAVHRFPQDITALAWHGSRLVVGDADGRVRFLRGN
jgi:hypothetical protein